MAGVRPCFVRDSMRCVAGWDAVPCACSMVWAWQAQFLILCARGTGDVRRCRCPRNHFDHTGEKNLARTENGSRNRILERIRAGLRTPAAEVHPSAAGGVIFAPIENPLERFQQECAANLMECLLAANPTESAERLARVLESLPAGEIFLQDSPSLRHLIELAKPGRPLRWSSEGAPHEASQATITLAEALIAQTGSVFVTASCGGRGASVVAPCHIVFATIDQLVPDLQTALANASKAGKLDSNSFACVISGSSRTADIEKILVQGAHGPRRLVVIVQRGDF